MSPVKFRQLPEQRNGRAEILSVDKKSAALICLRSSAFNRFRSNPFNVGKEQVVWMAFIHENLGQVVETLTIGTIAPISSPNLSRKAGPTTVASGIFVPMVKLRSLRRSILGWSAS